MSAVDPLTVTLELPATEYVDHESGPLVRCPLNGVWVALSDYYSEKEGQMLPLVGRVDYKAATEQWHDTGTVNQIKDQSGAVVREEKIMEVRPVENPVEWSAVVRVLEAPPFVEAEGGTLNLGVHEEVGTGDSFGG